MAGCNTYFISDLHLGAKYTTDHLERERRVCRFLDSIKDDALNYSCSVTFSIIGMSINMSFRVDTSAFWANWRNWPTAA